MPMPPDSPEDAKKAADRLAEKMRNAAMAAEERARRMAAFSAKAIDEEDAPVAVRSFNQAREGADSGKVYSHKTGRVEEGSPGVPLPRKAGGPRAPAIDDDELLREIDAAVDAAEGSQPAPLPDLGTDEDDELLDHIDAAVAEAKTSPPMAPAPPGMNARRLAAMAAAASDKGDVDTPPPAGISGGGPGLPRGLAALADGDAPAYLSERRPKGPTQLSEDDLSGLRPVGGVKPSHATAPARAPVPEDADGDDEAPTVVSGRGRGGVRHSEQDDDDLLAEIDAAVEAAEQEGS